ncbi:MAG: radical SAM protein [Candidatus Lokiarchaeota archaeon]|nr:radical SAM protein [Candidatus Lokiarchaeota archaeon]
MNYVVGNLVEPVFRPPSEWDALLIAITTGCTRKCTFCSMYRSKKFSIRKNTEEIKEDIRKARAFYGDRVQKIFFEDGNAFVVKTDILAELTRFSYEIHPNLRKVSAYAHAKDIVSKSDEELRMLAESGFTMVYVGIESGDDDVLKACKKGTTQDEIALAAQKCHKARIAWSGIFLLGLAGNDPEKSRKHAIESAKLINQMAPPTPIKWYVSPLTLQVVPNTELWEQISTGEFQPCSSEQILEELHTMIMYTSNDLHKCVFNTNHASNYMGLKGELARDKEKFLSIIEAGIKNPTLRRPDYLRGL